MGDQIAIGKEGDVKEEPMTTSDEEDEEDDYKMETPAWVSPKSNQTDNQKDEKVDDEEDEGPTPYKVQRRKDLQAVRIITAPVLRGEQPTPPWTDMSHIQGRFCFQPAVLMIGVEDNRYTSGRVRLGPWLYTEEKHEIGFYPDVPYDPEDLICNDMYFKFCAEDTTVSSVYYIYNPTNILAIMKISYSDNSGCTNQAVYRMHGLLLTL